MMVLHLIGIIYGRTKKAVLYLTGFSAALLFKPNANSLARLASVQACSSLARSEISRLISNFFWLVI